MAVLFLLMILSRLWTFFNMGFDHGILLSYYFQHHVLNDGNLDHLCLPTHFSIY